METGVTAKLSDWMRLKALCLKDRHDLKLSIDLSLRKHNEASDLVKDQSLEWILRLHYNICWGWGRETVNTWEIFDLHQDFITATSKRYRLHKTK